MLIDKDVAYIIVAITEGRMKNRGAFLSVVVRVGMHDMSLEAGVNSRRYLREFTL